MAWASKCVWVGVVWVAGVVGAVGQDAAVVPPATVEDALHEMSDAAGVIFAGQVTAVRRVAGVGGASGVVEVDFRVDNAVRGCVSDGTYTLREWAGLWAGGNARYRVGQRLLMMLRAPGASGMSSPVGGMDGAIPIRGVESEIATGSVTVAGATVSGGSVPGGEVGSPVAAPLVSMVDLRWVGTRMLRGSAVASGTSAGVGMVSGPSVGAGGSGGASVSVAAQGASVDTVMGMLGSWEVARAGR